MQNKIALVTGGGGGIGRATTKLFAREGAQVVIAEINEAQAQQVTEEIGANALAIAMDVTDELSINELFAQVEERFGRLDILVRNAGRRWQSTSLTATEDDWNDCLNLNLKSAWLCARAAHPFPVQ